MKRFLAIPILLLPTLVLGQSGITAVNLTNVPDGQYVLTVKGGTASVVPLVLIEPGVTPDVPDPPAPPVNDVAKQIVTEVSKIPVSDARHASALKLAATFQMLAGQVREEKLSHTSAGEAVRMFSSVVLGAEQAKWAGVLGVVNDSLATCASPAICATTLDTVATALQSTVPAGGDDVKAAAKRYGFDMDAFLAFLMELMKILLPLIIKV